MSPLCEAQGGVRIRTLEPRSIVLQGILLVSIHIVTVAASLTAQTIEGAVVDDATRTPLTGASVELLWDSSFESPRARTTEQGGVVLYWSRRSSETEGRPWRWKTILASAGGVLLLILLIR